MATRTDGTFSDIRKKIASHPAIATRRRHNQQPRKEHTRTMQDTITDRHDIGGVKFLPTDAAAAVATVRSSEKVQTDLQRKVGNRTKTERDIIREIYYTIQRYNRTDLWTGIQAAELIYSTRYHIKAHPLARIRDERQARKDHRKRSLKDKLILCMPEIHTCRQLGMDWQDIIRQLRANHRTQYYRETIRREYIRHIYYQWRQNTAAAK